MSDFAKVFWSGRTQAVSLPEAYRFDTEAVRIRREGEAVILEPVRDDWADFPRLRDDLADQVLAAAEEPTPQQERPDLDRL